MSLERAVVHRVQRYDTRVRLMGTDPVTIRIDLA